MTACDAMRCDGASCNAYHITHPPMTLMTDAAVLTPSMSIHPSIHPSMYPSIYTSIHRSLPSLLDRLLHAAVKAMVQPDGAVVAALPDAAAAIDLNHPTNDGTTPLMSASYMGHPEVVRVLLAAGADKDLRNNDGKTALDWAIDQKKDACAALLR